MSRVPRDLSVGHWALSLARARHTASGALGTLGTRRRGAGWEQSGGAGGRWCLAVLGDLRRGRSLEDRALQHRQ